MRIAREEIFGPVVSHPALVGRGRPRRARQCARLWAHGVDLDARPRSRASARVARRGRLHLDQRREHASRRRAVRRLQAIGDGPRGVDRGVAGLHADQERQCHAEAQRLAEKSGSQHKPAPSAAGRLAHRGGGHMHRLVSFVVGVLLAGLAPVASAEEIAVGNYGVSANGMPFGVALVKGYFKEEGLNITGPHFVGRRRHVAAQHAGRRRRALRRGESGRGRLRDPRRRGSQDHQRQRAHRRRVRLGGEARVVDQDDQGLQGQEDRLHEPALDEPGARADAAAVGGIHRGRRRARQDRRLRRRHRRARLGLRSTSRRSPSRCGRRSSTSTAPSSSRARRCRRSTTSSA